MSFASTSKSRTTLEGKHGAIFLKHHLIKVSSMPSVSSCMITLPRVSGTGLDMNADRCDYVLLLNCEQPVLTPELWERCCLTWWFRFHDIVCCITDSALDAENRQTFAAVLQQFSSPFRLTFDHSSRHRATMSDMPMFKGERFMRSGLLDLEVCATP